MANISEDRIKRIIRNICIMVSELPGRTSPEDEPDMMLVTSDELGVIVRTALEGVELAEHT